MGKCSLGLPSLNKDFFIIIIINPFGIGRMCPDSLVICKLREPDLEWTHVWDILHIDNEKERA